MCMFVNYNACVASVRPREVIGVRSDVGDGQVLHWQTVVLGDTHRETSVDAVL